MWDLRLAMIRRATVMEEWLMAHKLLVLLFMVSVMGYLLLEGKGLTLADLRFLWAYRFHTSEMTLGPREAALTYHRFLRIVSKKGYRKAASQTPVEFARTFEDTNLGGPVAEFTRLYNAFRFGRAIDLQQADVHRLVGQDRAGVEVRALHGVLLAPEIVRVVGGHVDRAGDYGVGALTLSGLDQQLCQVEVCVARFQSIARGLVEGTQLTPGLR